MDRFLLSENPMIDPDKRRVFIFHTQFPQMLIEVHHEAYAAGNSNLFLTGNYQNIDGVIETVTLETTQVFTEKGVEARVNKVLSKAWHWYTSYLKWEDEQIDENY